MPTTIEAAIFDADGMLLDSREFILRAYEHTFEAHGLAAPERSVVAEHMGKTLHSCYELLAPGHDTVQLKSTHVDFQSKNTHLITPYEGLTEMLDALRTKDLKIGVVSSRFNSLMRDLEAMGILEYLDVVVQGNEVSQPKPNPEGLLAALDEISVEPKNASMAGDTAEDILAGRAAGMAVTIGFTHGFGKEETLRSAQPNHIVHNLREIPPLLLET